MVAGITSIRSQIREKSVRSIKIFNFLLKPIPMSKKGVFCGSVWFRNKDLSWEMGDRPTGYNWRLPSSYLSVLAVVLTRNIKSKDFLIMTGPAVLGFYYTAEIIWQWSLASMSAITRRGSSNEMSCCFCSLFRTNGLDSSFRQETIIVQTKSLRQPAGYLISQEYDPQSVAASSTPVVVAVVKSLTG